ncbi:MAG TPA: tetratricopeptide repeat protein [Burkholderiales bacterium]|jgi:Flp pilus assembly protein TadD|nr:tetratricopeptide repeat protein [Burkholderiales bacterium]
MLRIPFYALLFVMLSAATSLQADELSDAQKLLQRGKPTEALARVEARVAAKPDDAQARFLRGVILSELGRTDEAKQAFRQLTVDFPEFPEPYNNLAVLHAAAGDYDSARQALEAAIRVNPKYATAHENLGDIYAELARRAYDKAAVLKPGARALHSKLALATELASSERPENPQ